MEMKTIFIVALISSIFINSFAQSGFEDSTLLKIKNIISDFFVSIILVSGNKIILA